MSDPDEENPTVDKFASWFGIGAWVLGLVLLFLVFGSILESDRNPNGRPQVMRSAGGQQAVVLKRNRQGHYLARGTINGVPVTFLVDTGATDVALGEPLALRLGLRNLGTGYSGTANGTVKVWRTKLESVRLGGIEQRDVRASVLPKMGADEVLLGMSFLKHLELVQREGQLQLRVPSQG